MVVVRPPYGQGRHSALAAQAVRSQLFGVALGAVDLGTDVSMATIAIGWRSGTLNTPLNGRAGG